jgi:hypothetical protein
MDIDEYQGMKSDSNNLNKSLSPKNGLNGQTNGQSAKRVHRMQEEQSAEDEENQGFDHSNQKQGHQKKFLKYT